MNGPQHYAEAARLLADLPDDYEAAELPQGAIQSALTIQRAQVHATLAMAAATVDAQRGGTAVWAEYPAPVEGD